MQSNRKEASLVTIAILAHNSESTIREAIMSCKTQKYRNLEILILENGSTDRTRRICNKFARKDKRIRLKENKNDLNISGNMNRYNLAKGEIFIWLCGDDIFASNDAVGRIVKEFDNPKIGHVSRYYYQFLEGKKGAVRAHRSDNIYCLANNPSGLAFRTSAMCGRVRNRAFIEAACMVRNVLDAGWEYKIIPEDLIAVRLGYNGASTLRAYRNSPTMSWLWVAGEQDFLFDNPIGYIQLKNWAKYIRLWKEVKLHFKMRPLNFLKPKYLFFVIIALVVPKFILRPATKFYKNVFGRYFLMGRI